MYDTAQRTDIQTKGIKMMCVGEGHNERMEPKTNAVLPLLWTRRGFSSTQPWECHTRMSIVIILLLFFDCVCVCVFVFGWKRHSISIGICGCLVLVHVFIHRHIVQIVSMFGANVIRKLSCTWVGTKNGR